MEKNMPDTQRPDSATPKSGSPSATPEEMRAAFSLVGRLLGSISSERKASAAQQNGRTGGRPRLPLDKLDCVCGEGRPKHCGNCPRGRAIRRRASDHQVPR